MFLAPGDFLTESEPFLDEPAPLLDEVPEEEE